jgi:hypothetical protein
VPAAKTAAGSHGADSADRQVEPDTSSKHSVISAAQCHNTLRTGQIAVTVPASRPRTKPTPPPITKPHAAPSHGVSAIAPSTAPIAVVVKNTSRARLAAERSALSSTSVTRPVAGAPL